MRQTKPVATRRRQSPASTALPSLSSASTNVPAQIFKVKAGWPLDATDRQTAFGVPRLAAAGMVAASKAGQLALCWGCHASPACCHPDGPRPACCAGSWALASEHAKMLVRSTLCMLALPAGLSGCLVTGAATVSEAGRCPTSMPHAAGSGGHSCGRPLQCQPPGDQPPHRGTLLRWRTAHELRRVGSIWCGKGVVPMRWGCVQ